jgi:penicillin-binding protein 1A
LARFVVKFARQAGIVVLFIVAAILGIASGVMFAFAGDIPRISELDDYAMSTISRVYAADGAVVGEFAIQRREIITYDDLSPHLIAAIKAAEDAEFDQHFGLSIPRIAVTLVKDIIERRKAGGASTLTQQLTRKLFLTDEKTWERKIKEAILAIQIEKRYTKREIFTLYCNQMYFGHGVYGVQAASRLYFGKTAKDLNIEEAALIAGILQGNVRQSPYVNMEAAVRRRNYALTRMEAIGYITGQEAEEARQRPIVVAGEPAGPPVHRAVFRGGGPQGPRGPVRREADLRERPVDPDGARHAAAGRGQPRARRRAAADRSAARLPPARAKRPEGRPAGRNVSRLAVGPRDAAGRHRPGRRQPG